MKYVYKYFILSIIFELKMNNQLVVLSGILVLLATATVATIYNVQTVEAKSPQATGNFGQTAASPQATDGVGNPRNTANGNGLTANSIAHNPDFGGIVSSIASPNKP